MKVCVLVLVLFIMYVCIIYLSIYRQIFSICVYLNIHEHIYVIFINIFKYIYMMYVIVCVSLYVCYLNHSGPLRQRLEQIPGNK